MMKFEDIIERDGRLIYTNVGDSMLLLIRQNRDLLIIEKPNGRLKKHNVPLYKRDISQYILHRVLKVRENDYVICGDNHYSKEYGITDRHIIGVLTAIVRDDKEIHINDWRYRLYVHLWCDFFPIRAFILKAKHFPKWLKRKPK